MVRNPLSGISYSRLKQTDVNGTFTFSQTVAVKIDLTKEIKVYPTVTRGDVFIDAEKGLKNAVIKITNVSGVLVKQINGAATNNNDVINLDELTSGIYFITIEIENEVSVFKVVKLEQNEKFRFKQKILSHFNQAPFRMTLRNKNPANSKIL